MNIFKKLFFIINIKFKAFILFNNKNNNYICFKNKKFNIRKINYKGYGDIILGPEKLYNLLIINNDYISEEARKIDDTILFYLPDNIIDLPEENIINYLDNNLF